MPEVGYMYSEIDGESNAKGHDKAVEVVEFAHSVRKEVDPLDCSKVKSDRRHAEASIIKYFDKASPLFAKKLCEGGTIPEIKIKWYRQPEGGGADAEHYFTHTFTDCIITRVEPYMPSALDPSKDKYGHMERVCWGYKQLTWTSESGGTEFTDSVRQ